MIKTVYCFNWLPRTFTGGSHWEVFLEIKLIQKASKFSTFWVHWKNQCRSKVRKYALLWNKHEYQHSADIFVKNIFNLFHGIGLFLYFSKYKRKPEVSWCFLGALKESSSVKWVKSHFISVTSFVTYLSNWRSFVQLKSFLQNEFVNFPHLILTANLSSVTLIKLLFFFLTLLVAFSSSLKHA